MYADRVRQVLEDEDIGTGDRIRVETPDGRYEGTLMPRSDQGDTDILTVKLDSGYNIGVRYTGEVAVERLAGHEDGTAESQDIPSAGADAPDIAILHTGGTIASKVSYEKGGVIPAFEPEELARLYPEVFEEVNVTSEVLGQIHSGDMEPAHWQAFAEEVAEHRDKDGIIIGHGTDTMQYTATALSFMLENIDVPVVLVGAQRSSDRPSSDSAINLRSAIAFALEGEPGVYICMHAGMDDDRVAIHRGTRARKMHTSRRDAFCSIDARPVAFVDYPSGDVTFNEDVPAADGDFALRTDLNTDVAFVSSRPGMDPAELESAAGHDGVVLAGTGLGHFPVNSFDEHTEHHERNLDAIAELADEGLAVMTSQTVSGRVNMNVYEYGVKIQDAGVVSAENMTPETAYVKLMWSLGQTDSREEAAELFRTDIAGEILDREEHDGFRG